MKTPGLLIDRQGASCARFHNAEPRHGAIMANYEILQMPEEAKAVFKEFEELAESQSFSSLDELEDKLRSFQLWIVWEGEEFRTKVWDVQMSRTSLSFLLNPDLNCGSQ